jgi:hypothetical protein
LILPEQKNAERERRELNQFSQQPVKPSGTTFDDLKKDPSVMQTIRKYTRDRYGTDHIDPDEAIEDFLSEYRGIQNNTFKALTFANYASEINDPEYKAQLGRLYKTFDYELENFC